MSTHYLLTCECGQVHRVTARQAGQSLSCVCRRSLEVPTLRGLRELPSESPGKDTGTRGNWSLSRGICFSVGLILLLAGGGGAYYIHLVVTKISVPSEESVMTELSQQIDQAKPADLWQLWIFLRDEALSSRPAPLRAEVEKIRGRMEWTRSIAAGFAGLGGLLMAVAYIPIGRLLGSPGTSRT